MPSFPPASPSILAALPFYHPRLIQASFPRFSFLVRLLSSMSIALYLLASQGTVSHVIDNLAEGQTV